MSLSALVRCLLSPGVMTLPRAVRPGRFLMVNRRGTQQQFLLRPDVAATNQTYLYCLAVAAQRFDIEVVLPSVMSNHHHDVILDRFTTRQFREYFRHAAGAVDERCAAGERTSGRRTRREYREPRGREAVMDKLVRGGEPGRGGLGRAGAPLAWRQRPGRPAGRSDADHRAAAALLPRRRRLARRGHPHLRHPARAGRP
ncbi:MAG: hypothetical protein R3B06_08340 [Kofleriaceae bacterium]